MIKVLIQVTSGSSERRIYDERTLEYKETRQGSISYIYPYGFILGTRAEDDCSVDCYIITRDNLQAGSIVECEPIGLLEQNEGGEIDHKILASLPDEKAEVSQELWHEMQDFIHLLFSAHPEIPVTVGNILPREDALRHIEEHREK
jgi:inorganic pyrophosphatase